jgi:hypothetical protein
MMEEGSGYGWRRRRTINMQNLFQLFLNPKGMDMVGVCL